MNIRLDHLQTLDLDSTLCCGQAFRWDKHGEWWYGIVKDKAFKIRQRSNRLEFENVEICFLKAYLGLDDNLQEVYSQIRKDRHVEQAVERFRGLRILRQDPWECLISYICATYKNIASIKGMLLNLSRKFGDKVTFNGLDFYTFPTAEKLARASASEISDCSLGYRAKYVHETAVAVHEGKLELEYLVKISYEEAKAELLNLPGVGLKVADCISLFSLGKFEAFPVDVWVKRALMRHYNLHFPREFIRRISDRRSLTNSEYGRLNVFGREYFGGYAGYAQEYLYHYERMQR